MTKVRNDRSDGPQRAVTGDVRDVVVRAGAAGPSGGLLLGRARRMVAVIDAGRPRDAPVGCVHGFLARDGMAPAGLLDLGPVEVARHGVQLIGLRGELPDISGERERWGKDEGRVAGWWPGAAPVPVLSTPPSGGDGL